MINTTDLDTKKTAADLVNAWNEATEIINHSEKELKRAAEILKAAYGDSMSTIPHSYSGFDEIRKDNTSRAWRQIIARLGIRRTMSHKRLEEMDKNIEKGNMPEINLTNVRGISEALVENAAEFAAEAVAEVFDYLRPGASEYNKLKTNQKNARFTLGPKVILTGVIDQFSRRWGGFSVSYWHADKLAAVDNVFHLADGNAQQMSSAYNSPLIDAIQTSDGKGETNYFRFECYKNGNLHLYFKRMDLVTKLNHTAGGSNRLAGL